MPLAAAGLRAFERVVKMDNIISSILEIEQNAKKRLAEAEEKKDAIIADAEREKKKIIREKIRAAEDKKLHIRLDETKRTDEKLAEIEKIKNGEIKRLDRIYSEKHTEWENSIFDNVISR